MKLAYAIFYSPDVLKVSAFYTDTLGLTKAFGDEDFVAFTVGDSLLGIKKATEEREIPGSQTVIVSVEDIASWNEKMKNAGVQFSKELSEESWGKNFSILDPDGNKIEFVGK